jgi:hypothetical protein
MNKQLSAEADSLRDKGTKWQRDKVNSLSLCVFLCFVPVCLCNLVPSLECESKPRGEGSSHTLRRAI